MFPKYIISILCQFDKNVVLRFSCYGDIMKTQTIRLYLCDIYITQSLSPKCFLGNSVPGPDVNVKYLFEYCQCSFKESSG